jgi:hypothetical protein
MPKAGDVFKSLAQKAGIKIDDETLKKILAIQDFSNMDVPDEFANPLERNLLTEDSAAVHSKVRTKIIGEAFSGIDGELGKWVDDGGFEFDDDFKTQFKSIEKNTNEKLRRLKEGVTKLMEKKGKGTKADDAALQKEIDRLNGEAGKIKSSYDEKIQQIQQQHQTEKLDWNLQSTLAGKPLPKNGLPHDVNILTAKTLVNNEMAKNGLFIALGDNGLPVLKQKKDGSDMDYFVDNKKVDYASFVDGVLAQNKFLHLTDPNPQNPPAPGNNPPTPGNPVNQHVVSELDSQLQQFNQV